MKEPIRFRRDGSAHWECAADERELFQKLEGAMAEIVMPAQPWYVRLWRAFFPLKFQEIKAEELVAVCEVCGESFEPTPDSFWECGLNAISEEEAALMGQLEGADLECMTLSELMTASPQTLAKFGLDAAARDELLEKGSVDTGAVAVCPKSAATIRKAMS